MQTCNHKIYVKDPKEKINILQQSFWFTRKRGPWVKHVSSQKKFLQSQNKFLQSITKEFSSITPASILNYLAYPCIKNYQDPFRQKCLRHSIQNQKIRRLMHVRWKNAHSVVFARILMLSKFAESVNTYLYSRRKKIQCKEAPRKSV